MPIAVKHWGWLNGEQGKQKELSSFGNQPCHSIASTPCRWRDRPLLFREWTLRDLCPSLEPSCVHSVLCVCSRDGGGGGGGGGRTDQSLNAAKIRPRNEYFITGTNSVTNKARTRFAVYTCNRISFKTETPVPFHGKLILIRTFCYV